MRTTVALDDDLAAHVDAQRPQDSDSDAEAVRECIRRSQELTDCREECANLREELDGLRESHEQEVAVLREDYETELQHKQARIDELNSKLAEAHSRIETTNELVSRVDSELSARERREQRERKRAEAGLATRIKWSLFGMDLSDDEN